MHYATARLQIQREKEKAADRSCRSVQPAAKRSLSFILIAETEKIVYNQNRRNVRTGTSTEDGSEIEKDGQVS